MSRKRFSVEQIINHLREAEVFLSQGQTVGEIFYTLKEARVLIEQWRDRYNTIRPHSALGYRPPAPQTIRKPVEQHDQFSRSRHLSRSGLLLAIHGGAMTQREVPSRA
jgi:hypothetical protein